MIWNKHYLFIHAPKTAGMSMTKTFLNGLEGPVFYTGPHERRRQGKIVYVPGKRHETLVDAESHLTYVNRSLSDFRRIFVVMRSPYDLEVSRYAYLRKGLDVDRGPAQDIAINSSFKEYLRSAPFFGQNPPRLDRYYHINNTLPGNLVILKFEDLNAEVARKAGPHLKAIELGRENASERPPVAEMYDVESEQLCYDRHPWFFDKGFYSRLDLT